MDPMQKSARLVAIQRKLNTLGAIEKRLTDEKESLQASLLEDMIEGRFPESSTIDGASVHTRRRVFFGPAEGHAQLAAVLKDLGEDELLPSTVNSQRLSSFVREHLDPDEKLSIKDRLLSPNPKPLDPRLLEAIKINEKLDVVATGAGVEPDTTEEVPF